MIVLLCDVCGADFTTCNHLTDNFDFGFAVDQPTPDNSTETFELKPLGYAEECLGCGELIDQDGQCGCRDNPDDHYFVEYN